MHTFQRDLSIITLHAHEISRSSSTAPVTLRVAHATVFFDQPLYYLGDARFPLNAPNIVINDLQDTKMYKDLYSLIEVTCSYDMMSSLQLNVDRFSLLPLHNDLSDKMQWTKPVILEIEKNDKTWKQSNSIHILILMSHDDLSLSKSDIEGCSVHLPAELFLNFKRKPISSGNRKVFLKVSIARRIYIYIYICMYIIFLLAG